MNHSSRLVCIFIQLQRLRSNPSLLCRRFKTYKSSIRAPDEIVIQTNKLEKDLLVYTHTEAKYFGLVLSVFAGAAAFFLTTADSFRVVGKTLRQHKANAPPEKEKEEQVQKRWGMSLWKFKDGSLHDVFAVFFAGIGLVCLLAMLGTPSRYLRSVVVMKDGKSVCLSTFSPVPSKRHISLPISEVYASPPYSLNKAALVRVKGQRVPFYLSSRGSVLNLDQLRQVLRAG